MPYEEFDRILKHTLADYRVSRNERRMLSSILREMGEDEHKLALLRSRAFDIARAEIPGPQAVAVLEWLEEIVKVLQPRRPVEQKDSRAYFSPGADCRVAISRRLDLANQQVDICVFTITDDRITDRILGAHRRGVSVRVIADNDKAEDLGSDILQLIRAGVPVRLDRTEFHMHHKYAVFNREVLITGSYNWTRSAAEHNEENIAVIGDASLVRQYLRHFQRLWDQLA